MRKITWTILTLLGVSFFIALALVNVGVIIPQLKDVNGFESLNNIAFTFDVGLLFTTTYKLYFYLWCALMIFFMFTLLENSFKKNEKRRTAMKKYERDNYSRWQSKWQRSRGTLRLKFDNKGQVTFKGIEELFVRLKNPITVLQNRIADWREWPATKRWNKVETFQNNGQETRIAGGLPVMAMRKYLLFGRYNQVWYLVGDKHNLFVGSTGRGKTMTFVLAMIFSYIAAQESMVIHDPKGELYAQSYEKLKKEGYKVIKLDFIDPDCSDGWNPFDVPYKAWCKAIEKKEIELMETHDADDNGNFINRSTGEVIFKKDIYKISDTSSAVEQVLDISQTLSYEEDSKNPFFHEGAGDMIAGGAMFMMEEGNPDYVNAKSIRYLFGLGEDGNSGSKKGPSLLSKVLEETREIDSGSRSKLDTYLTAEGVTRSGLKATFTNKMSLLTATEAIIKMTSNSTFDMHDIFKEKTAVFLMTHDEKTTYYPLVTMFFKQLYEVGIKESRTNPMRRLLIPMNWVIDEMAQLPEIKDIGAIYTAARSRGVRINSFIQSFEQLIEKYESNTASIIEDNSTNVIYLGSKAKTTQESFSKMAGTELYWNSSKKEYAERPLITADRLSKFEKGRSLLTTIEWNPFIVKLPPFNKYVFSDKSNWQKEKVEKPEVKFYNIREEYNKSVNSKLKKQNNKMIGFNNLGMFSTAGLMKKDPES